MTKQYFKDVRDGYLHGYSKYHEGKPHLVLVTEEEAYPERFIPDHAKQANAKPRKGLALETPVVPPEELPPTNEELNAEATRRKIK